MGGAKATIPLAGRPLIEYPIAALRAELDEVVVVAKAGSELPPLPGVEVWHDPAGERHPAAGIAHALAQAGERWVLVCAGDMPLVPGEVLRALLGADRGNAPAVVCTHAGGLEPLLALYGPVALPPLGAEGDRPLREIVAALDPVTVEVRSGTAFFNVNRPEDLARAEEELLSRR